MAASPYPTQDIREYDVRSAAIVVAGNRVEDISTFGWDMTKDHTAEKTVDRNAVWVKATPEVSGSIAMYATSPSVPVVEAVWKNDQVFNISAKTSDDDPRGTINFVGCMLTDVNTGDHEDSSAPEVTAEWTGVDLG